MESDTLDEEDLLLLDEGEKEETAEFVNLRKRVRTPTIIQIEATECGAVSLAIILAYYGKYVTIEELRVACNVTRDGASASNVSEAAQAYGLTCEGYSLDLEEIKTASLPAIIFWDFEHFVVFEGYGKDCFYINDPGTGPRSVTVEEFDQSFTGLVLELTPSESFVKSGKKASMVEMIYGQLKNVKGPIIYIFLAQLGLLVPTLAFPAISQIFTDKILVSYNEVWGKYLFFAVLLVVAVTALLVYLQERIFMYLRVKLSVSMASRALWRLLSLPIPFFSHRFPGEIAYRLTLIDSVAQGLSGQLATTFLSCIMIGVYGVVIAYYSPFLALIAGIAGVINFSALYFVLRSRNNDLIRYQANMGKSTGYSLGLIDNIETIKGLGLENQYFSQWAGYFTKVQNSLQVIGKKDIVLGVITPLVNALTVAAFIGVSGWLVLTGQLTVGMFMALQILISYFMAPIMELVSFSQVIQQLKVNLTRLNDLLHYPIDNIYKEQEQLGQTENYSKLDGYVELKNVSYGYNRLEPPLLDQINLSLRPGRSVALVGKSGCGKSTLTMIVAGLLTPWEGEILYDGQPRERISRKRLSSSMSMIEQSPFLFKGSVKDNLSMYNPLVLPEELNSATKDACIYENIMARRGGYDLELEDNGGNLSGGERQRLEIARGLLKNPSILVLDECTSALDSETEDILMRNIHKRGCAILMIAHRLSSVKNCDEICVMDKGKIVERGTHEQLKEKSLLYRELVNVEGTNET